MELSYEPRNVQVIVANEDSRLFLVNESGIVKEESDHVSVEINAHVHTDSHVTINNESVEEINTLRRQLNEARLEIEGLRNEMNTRDETLAALRSELDTANENLRTAEGSRAEIERLQDALKLQTTKAKRFWSQKCEQLLVHETAMEEKDESIATKDAEIARLQSELEGSRETRPQSTDVHSVQHDSRPGFISNTEPILTHACCGKAPPIDPFRGNDPEVQLDDWLPTLERAAVWNNWSEEECLIQLAGHLRGRASQEWNLLSADEKSSFSAAVTALRTRLDPGRQALAAQDFRHAIQRERKCGFLHHKT